MNDRISVRTFGSFSFFQMIDYIKNDCNGSVIFSQNKEFLIKERAYYVANYICKLHLTNIEAYYQATKSILNLHYKLPIYLSKHLIFLTTNSLKNYNNIFINYANIKSNTYNDNLAIIYFNSGTKLATKITNTTFDNYITKLFIIKKHLNSNT